MADRSPKMKFTLIELLVVVGIVSVFVGLLLPAVSKVRPVAPPADTLPTARG